MKPGSRSATARLGAPIAFAVFVLVIWQVLATVTSIPASSLPSPVEVAQAGWDHRQLLFDNSWVTVVEILVGLLVAIVLGISLAVLIHSSKLVERALYPWMVVSQMIPIVAIAPIILIWTGFDLRPKVIVIALVSFFPIAVNMIDGLRAADPQLLRLIKTMRASSWQAFRLVQLPAALPHLFSGLKVAAAFSVVGAVFAEWVGSSEGLGHLILVFNNGAETAAMFATVFVLSLVGVALFGFVLLLERLLMPWYFALRDGSDSDGEGAEPPEASLRLR